MRATRPSVTVLIPARNEEADIAACLHAVMSQDYPHSRIEIVLVDGGSTDRTQIIARELLSAGDIEHRVVENLIGTTPSNLNAGLAVAGGEIVCRVDARSIIPENYVRLCVEVLCSRPDVIVTGGAQVATAVDESARSTGVARALNNRYSMGGSRYRRGARSGPSDTVYLGAFRLTDLLAVGGWDEAMRTNQDYELNRRLGVQGTVWYDHRLQVHYIPRQSIGGLWRQYYRFGRWKVRYWRHTGDRPRARQLIPVVGMPILVGVGVIGLMAPGERKRRARRLGVAVVVCIGAIDALGSRQAAGVPTRLASSAASTVVISAWLTGVGREALAHGTS